MAKATRAAAIGSVGGVRRTEAVDEVSRTESPASIAIKSLELDGVKAADLKVRVEANERALDDLQKVQSKAGDIADKAAEATPEGMSAAAGKVDELLEEGVSIANRKGEEGDFLFGGDLAEEEPFVATKDAKGKITEVNYQGSSEVGVDELGSGFSVTTDIPGENTETTGAIGLMKDSRTGGDLFGNLISLRDNLMANEKEAIVERDIPALRRDAEHLIQHFGELSANLMMLDTVAALANDLEGSDGKAMSTVDKLGNIQYALHRALVDNRNFIQRDSFRAVN
ncbi:MAG: flagellin-like hook-associated protein FlgL [Limisphaerales bacterium]